MHISGRDHQSRKKILPFFYISPSDVVVDDSLDIVAYDPGSFFIPLMPSRDLGEAHAVLSPVGSAVGAV